MTRQRVLLTLSTLAFAACAGRAREQTLPGPAPRSTAAAPAPVKKATETLPPGTYEPFEPPPSPERRDSPDPVADQGRPGGGVPETAAAAPPAGAVEAFMIQVAAFAQREPADDLAELLGRRYGGYPIRVVSRAGLFRVWLGGWASRDDAASVLVIVRQRYPDAWIVAP